MTESEKFEIAFNVICRNMKCQYWLIRNKNSDEYVSETAKIAYAVWQAAKATPAMPQWIPVGERMPEQSQLGSAVEYLVYEKLNNKVQHDYYIIPKDGAPPFWSYYQDNVTHWMPLPAAPEQPE